MAETDSGPGGLSSSLRQPAPAELIPGTSGWRVWVASWAHSFFKTPQNPDIAAAIGKAVHPTTITPWSVADYSKYLSAIGLRDAEKVAALNQVLNALERAGFLMPCGLEPGMPAFMAQRYMTQGGASPGQVGGTRWLSQIFGAELMIPSYNGVTVQISGTDTAGRARSGTGLVLDHWHIVTNKHVADGLAPNAPIVVTPANVDANADHVSCQCIGVAHREIDVAIIKCELPDGVGIPRLGGMAFRDPEWADEVYLFGYPHVPMIAGDVITAQRGEVVNPSAETPAVGGLPRQKTFLYSAIAAGQ